MIVKIKLEDEISVDLEIDKEICKKIKENISQIIYTELAEEIEKNLKKIKDIDKIDEEIVLDMPKVDDVYRYLISCDEKNKLSKVNLQEYNDGESSEFKDGDRSTSEDKDYETIVLLLESPHKNEYTDKREPIGPAIGKTGEGIDKNIMIILREIQNIDGDLFKQNKNYRIIICNPIQYQTSLYMYHNEDLKDKYKTLRNNFWKKLWKEEKIKANFKERMNEYKPKLIINACTLELKEFIRDYLKQENFNNVYETFHPSYWKSFDLKKID